MALSSSPTLPQYGDQQHNKSPVRLMHILTYVWRSKPLIAVAIYQVSSAIPLLNLVKPSIPWKVVYLSIYGLDASSP